MNSSASENGSTVRIMNFDVPIDTIQIPVPQIVFRSTMTVVGALLNALLLAVICVSRQLHYPRHLYWVAVAIANHFYLANQTVELVAILYRDRIACRLYVLNATVGYSLLLVCLFLATFDRYLAIVNQEWYKEKVTNRAVVILICGAMLVTYTIITCPFWTGMKSINSCTVNLTHMHWVLVGNLLLSVSCLVIHGKIFITSRSIINQHPQLFKGTATNAKFSNTVRITYQRRGRDQQVDCANEILGICEEPPLPAEPSRKMGTGQAPRRENEQVSHCANEVLRNRELEQEATGLAELSGKPETGQTPREENGTETEANGVELFPRIHHIRPTISRFKIRAALNLSINILPFWVCTLPATCNGLVIYWCIRMETSCPTIFAINFFLRNMFLLQSIYNPIMYMLTSTEVRRALLHLFAKLCRGTTG